MHQYNNWIDEINHLKGIIDEQGGEKLTAVVGDEVAVFIGYKCALNVSSWFILSHKLPIMFIFKSTLQFKKSFSYYFGTKLYVGS